MIDQVQDFVVLDGYENDTHTVVEFSRKLDTCDREQVIITNLLLV
jgi:hypothetical protein